MCVSPWKHMVSRINWSTVQLLLPTLRSCSPLITLLLVLTLLMSSILSSPLLSPLLSSPLLSLAVCLAYDGPEAAMLSSPLNLLFLFSQGPDPAILSALSLLESSFLFILASSSSHSCPPLFFFSDPFHLSGLSKTRRRHAKHAATPLRLCPFLPRSLPRILAILVESAQNKRPVYNIDILEN